MEEEVLVVVSGGGKSASVIFWVKRKMFQSGESIALLKVMAIQRLYAPSYAQCTRNSRRLISP